MLSLFPQILFLAPLGTALIRIAAGIVILYTAYTVFTHEEAFTKERLPVVGHAPAWLLSLGAFITLVDGVLITIGLFTQAAAILGFLIAIKIALFNRKHAALMPLSIGTALLLAIMCLSLIVSGAGAFAFDLPL